MRLQIDEIIAELKHLLSDNKSPRNRVLLEQALKSLQDFKRINEKKLI